MIKIKTIGFPHKPSEGGPGSFQIRLSEILVKKGWRIVYPKDDIIPDIILVVGGTRKLLWLWKCKRRGSKIVHRLDGLNWQHKIIPSTLKHKTKATLINYLIRIIRNYLANHVVYQSKFIRECWYRFSGPTKCPESIIYNAVDLKEFYPKNQMRECENVGMRECENEKMWKRGEGLKPNLVCVEGTIQSHPAYIKPLKYLSKYLSEKKLINKTIICGKIKQNIKDELTTIEDIDLKGTVKRKQIPLLLHNALYLCLEVNPPCPNAVIEALASGCPVLGFDSGALKELVPENAGVIVPYGGDPWKLDEPDYKTLLKKTIEVINNYHVYSFNARKTAEKHFNLNLMVKSYTQVFLDTLEKNK